MMWYSTGLETARNRSTASTTVAYAENMDEMSFAIECGLEPISFSSQGKSDNIAYYVIISCVKYPQITFTYL